MHLLRAHPLCMMFDAIRCVASHRVILVFHLWIVPLVHEDERDVEDQGHEPRVPGRGIAVVAVGLLESPLALGGSNQLVDARDDDGDLGDAEEGRDDNVAAEVDRAEHYGHIERVHVVVLGCCNGRVGKVSLSSKIQLYCKFN